MSITASDVTARANYIWKDAGTNYSANALKWLSDAYLELRSLRPEIRLNDDSGELQDFAEITASGDVIPINAKFRPILVDYVVARGFQENGKDENQRDRANQHFKLFYERAKVV